MASFFLQRTLSKTACPIKLILRSVCWLNQAFRGTELVAEWDDGVAEVTI